ncbi:MAG: PhzF family phenazine biosynthesis protein [Anaerolineae bacterium]
MRRVRFVQVDVFSDSPFGGNPVVVVPQAQGISEEQMQTIARGLFVETAFVLPPTDPQADFRVRFFTPTTKVPFSGHPTLGVAYVLAEEGLLELQAPVTRVHEEMEIGVLPIDLFVEGEAIAKVVMTEKSPTFHGSLEEVAELAAALSVEEEEITATGLPPQMVSTGLPALMVPLRSLAVVQNLGCETPLDVPRLNAICEELGAKAVMVFTFETLERSSTVHVRLFAPLLGVEEDPATGSASGALGAYLVQHQAIPVQPLVKICTEQGFEIGRPCTVHVEVDTTGERLGIRVGGQVARSVEGYIYY